MLSSFLKKLLFARQFFMADGKIEILGKKQVMLPSDVIAAVEGIDHELVYNNVKNTVKKDIEDYAKKLGSSEEGILKNIGDIFGTFGLGRLEIVDLDNKKKICIIRVHNSPLMEIKNSKSTSSTMTPAIISGVFSFLFDKEVDAKQTNPSVRGFDYYEYVIK